jgi:hypothetical protein
VDGQPIPALYNRRRQPTRAHTHRHIHTGAHTHAGSYRCAHTHTYSDAIAHNLDLPGWLRVQRGGMVWFR